MGRGCQKLRDVIYGRFPKHFNLEDDDKGPKGKKAFEARRGCHAEKRGDVRPVIACQ